MVDMLVGKPDDQGVAAVMLVQWSDICVSKRHALNCGFVNIVSCMSEQFQQLSVSDTEPRGKGFFSLVADSPDGWKLIRVPNDNYSFGTMDHWEEVG